MINTKASYEDPKNPGLILPYRNFGAPQIRQARKAFKTSNRQIKKQKQLTKLKRTSRHTYAYLVGMVQHPQANEPEFWEKIVMRKAIYPDFYLMIPDMIPLKPEVLNTIFDLQITTFGSSLRLAMADILGPVSVHYAAYPWITEHVTHKLLEVENDDRNGKRYSTFQALTENNNVTEEVKVIAALTMGEPPQSALPSWLTPRSYTPTKTEVKKRRQIQKQLQGK